MMRLALAFVAVLPLLSACESVDETAGAAQGPTVVVRMFSVSETGIGAAIGTVTLADAASGLTIQASLEGLPPGQRGFHVHEKGDCSSGDGMSTGGHFNPGGKAHGHHAGSERHAGDMPIRADANGNAEFRFDVPGLTIGAGAADIVGKGLIVHRDPDDYKTQPAGNAGPRIACAVIARS